MPCVANGGTGCSRVASGSSTAGWSCRRFGGGGVSSLSGPNSFCCSSACIDSHSSTSRCSRWSRLSVFLSSSREGSCDQWFPCSNGRRLVARSCVFRFCFAGGGGTGCSCVGANDGDTFGCAASSF